MRSIANWAPKLTATMGAGNLDDESSSFLKVPQVLFRLGLETFYNG